MNIFFRHTNSLLVILAVLITLGCSTSEKTVSRDDPDTAGDRIVEEDMTSLQTMLANNRSSLSDVHTSLSHDMPPSYLKKDSSDAYIQNDPSDGYRVQIISTKNVDLADSVANQYHAWADSTIEGYSAETYVSFRQPFFKVHVGDFQQREQANSFSKLLKRKYPDAWVVHDRIEPSEAPSDTTVFSFHKEGVDDLTPSQDD